MPFVKECGCGHINSEQDEECGSCGKSLGPDVRWDEPKPVASLCLVEKGGRAKVSILSGNVLGKFDPEGQGDFVAVPKELDPEKVKYLSRKHCRFDLRANQWFVTPLPSVGLSQPNPTFKNGKRLAPDDPSLLLDGDTLTLVELEFVVKYE